MKKFTFILLLILFSFVTATTNAVTNVAGDMLNAGEKLVLGILEVGFIEWIKANWIVVPFIIVGIGRVYTKATPNPDDDKWYNKYVLGYFWKVTNYISHVLQLGK